MLERSTAAGGRWERRGRDYLPAQARRFGFEAYAFDWGIDPSMDILSDVGFDTLLHKILAATRAPSSFSGPPPPSPRAPDGGDGGNRSRKQVTKHDLIGGGWRESVGIGGGERRPAAHR